MRSPKIMANRSIDRPVAGKVILSDLELERLRLERGRLGQFFGASGQMAYYIALACIVLAFTAAVIFAVIGVEKEYGSFATSLLTLGGGLIGGRGMRA